MPVQSLSPRSQIVCDMLICHNRQLQYLANVKEMFR